MAVKELKEIGLEPINAINFFEKEIKWNTVGPNVSTIITDGGSKEVTAGASFGVGFNFREKELQQ